MCCGLAMRYRHGLAQLCGVSSRARETKSAVTTVGVMDATLVEKRRGRKARVHCLHLELKGVCWRETWNERKKRREGGKGEEGKPRRSCNGPIQGELKSKHLICIFVTFSHSKIEAACCTQRHNRPSIRVSSEPAIPNTHIHMLRQRAVRTLAPPSSLSPSSPIS